MRDKRNKKLFVLLIRITLFLEKIMAMDANKKRQRYQRIYKQIEELLKKSSDKVARMNTVASVLHHKFDYFFWTGFYCLVGGKLIVRNYQGPVACMELAKDTGVCWASINQKKSIVVPNVEEFPGHIACDSRSKSEIVIPLKNHHGTIVGVLDIDSKDLNSFDEVDREELEKIVDLVYKV
jgi:L-methionine (R)-S-oxide reductase